MSLEIRNTGHYRYLHNPEYPEQGTVIITISTKLPIRTTSTA